MLSAAALISGLLLAGCGTAAKQSTTTTNGSGRSASAPGLTRSTRTTSRSSRTQASTTTSRTDRSTTASGTPPSSPIGFSRCMRANGVSDFPDPTPGKGFAFQVSSSVSSSPAFQSAQTKCQKLIVGSGPGFQGNPSKKTMAKLLKIANCMRAHGIHQFPDPLYARPRHFAPGAYQEITDFDGATLLFPTGMNLQAPAYRQALTACGSPPLGLHH
jgi:outer membrane murein-binding lipoprotein Lpp